MRLALIVLFLASACGIKAPPRPPLDEPVAPRAAAPDAGCCREGQR
ncbi:MAG TPA: hypothetical protein VGD87_08565 [Archangium sp.]